MILTRAQRKEQRNERMVAQPLIVRPRVLRVLFLCVLCSFPCVLGGRASAAGGAQQPQPFPRPGQPARPAQPPPATPAPAPPAAEATPTEATLGVPVFPGAQ